MPSAEPPRDPDLGSLEEIVPARAVLTELARGFLLAQATSPERAVRFAEDFLKEREGRVADARVEPVPKLTLARLALGRHHRSGGEAPPPANRP